MNAECVITTHALTRRFGDTIAVNALNLDIRQGEVFGFLGHNGAGKTTTVRLLNGVLASNSGSACVLGIDPATDGATLRRRTGVLTESPALDEKLTAREQLAIYAALYNVPRGEIDSRIKALLEDFGLSDRANEPVGGYSKGMRQRLALARTLIHNPELIFLDEPTAGLDPVVTRHVHERIQHLSHAGRRTVFLCTHNLTEAQSLCDRVAVMEHGRLVVIGTPKELAQQLWKGVRLEIEMASAQAQAALTRTQAFPNSRDVQWQASTVEPGVGLMQLWLPTRAAIPDLLTTLVATGARIYRLSPQEPTLEDVYFSLHEKQEGKPA